MKLTTKFAKLLFCVLLCSMPYRIMVAQEPDDVILQMQARYGKAKSMEMRLEMNIVYASAEIQHSRLSGILKSSTTGYFTDLDGQITLMNDHCWLIINRRQKSATYNAYRGEEMPSTQLLDTTIWKGTALKFVKEVEMGKVYRFDYDINMTQMPYEYVLYTISKDFLIVEIEYVYKDLSPAISPQKVVINFQDIQLNDHSINDVFSENNYLILNENGVELKAPYEKFLLQDMTKQ